MTTDCGNNIQIQEQTKDHKTVKSTFYAFESVNSFL